MPWEPKSMSEMRLEFVRLAGADGACVRALCRRFGISAKTGYKWIGRYAASGAGGLGDRSRRPLSSPRRVAAEIEAAVLAVRHAHPAWGGRKIAARLRRLGEASPSPSTVTAILRRHGIVLGDHGGGAAAFCRFEHAAPNDLWQMDFKGSVGLGDGTRLHPLTVLDDHSRYALTLSACANQQTATVRERLVAAFRRYGLPKMLITDNGSPWGDGPGSPFTPLGVFLIEQGVRIAHARPYHPQTMGKDERFHRSLKAEVLAGRTFPDLAAAETALAQWRMVYNSERPHEALGLVPPLDRYRPSPRSYQDRVVPFEYAPGDILRRVQQGGRLSFAGRTLRVPKAFAGQTIALRPTTDDGCYEVYFRHQRIARLDLEDENGDAQTVTHVPEQLLPITPV